MEVAKDFIKVAFETANGIFTPPIMKSARRRGAPVFHENLRRKVIKELQFPVIITRVV